MCTVRINRIVRRALWLLAGSLISTFLVLQFAPGGPVDHLLTGLFDAGLPSDGGPLR